MWRQKKTSVRVEDPLREATMWGWGCAGRDPEPPLPGLGAVQSSSAP